MLSSLFIHSFMYSMYLIICSFIFVIIIFCLVIYLSVYLFIFLFIYLFIDSSLINSFIYFLFLQGASCQRCKHYWYSSERWNICDRQCPQRWGEKEIESTEEGENKAEENREETTSKEWTKGKREQTEEEREGEKEVQCLTFRGRGCQCQCSHCFTALPIWLQRSNSLKSWRHGNSTVTEDQNVL